MTALLVRERRPFRIYSEYVEQNCCAYKETQKFLAHAQHPLYKGVTNRLLSGTVPFILPLVYLFCMALSSHLLPGKELIIAARILFFIALYSIDIVSDSQHQPNI